jgi:hypothetical protein
MVPAIPDATDNGRILSSSSRQKVTSTLLLAACQVPDYPDRHHPQLECRRGSTFNIQNIQSSHQTHTLDDGGDDDEFRDTFVSVADTKHDAEEEHASASAA